MNVLLMCQYAMLDSIQVETAQIEFNLEGTACNVFFESAIYVREEFVWTEGATVKYCRCPNQAREVPKPLHSVTIGRLMSSWDM